MLSLNKESIKVPYMPSEDVSSAATIAELKISPIRQLYIGVFGIFFLFASSSSPLAQRLYRILSVSRGVNSFDKARGLSEMRYLASGDVKGTLLTTKGAPI